MLSNAYFLAKFRFDTAENEPAKNLLIFPILLAGRSPRHPQNPVGERFVGNHALDDLGSSGIKFEVEGGEGSPGADTYIPPPKKLQSFFIFHRKLRFCSIFLKFSKNAAFWENPEKIW